MLPERPFCDGTGTESHLFGEGRCGVCEGTGVAAAAEIAQAYGPGVATRDEHCGTHDSGQPRREDLPRIEAWLVDRYGWSNLRAQVDAALGDPVSARRHTRNANRALVGLRVVRGVIAVGIRIGHVLNVARECVARELRS